MVWRAASRWQPSDPDTVDLWRFSLVAGGDSREKECLDVLRPEECARAERLIIPGKRRQFIVGRASVRRILARYLGAEPEGIDLVYGPHGKPAVAGSPDLSFNLSHSGTVAVLGVVWKRRLGVDVEETRTGRAFTSIAENFFSEPERASLFRLPSARRAHAFYRAWTRKEAYLKALGTGLSFASTRFTITFDPDKPAKVVHTEFPGDAPENWTMVDLDPGRGYAAAVCVETSDAASAATPRIRRWEFPSSAETR